MEHGRYSERAEEEPLLPVLGRASSRSDLVAEVIRTAILDGRLRPGRTLVERKLAEMLGVSKTPVREALIGLTRSGLVTVNPNRGMSVRVIDDVALQAIYEMRLLLEPWAVARVATSWPREVYDEATAILREAEVAIEVDDYPALTRVNRRFHRALYAHCGNELVWSSLDQLQDQIALGVVSLWHTWPSWHEETHEHRSILDAVRDGDAERSQVLMQTHIESALQRVEYTQTGRAAV